LIPEKRTAPLIHQGQPVFVDICFVVADRMSPIGNSLTTSNPLMKMLSGGGWQGND